MGEFKKYEQQVTEATESARALDDYQFLMCSQIESLKEDDPRRYQMENYLLSIIGNISEYRLVLEAFKVNPEMNKEELTISMKEMRNCMREIAQYLRNPNNGNSVNIALDSLLSLKQAGSKSNLINDKFSQGIDSQEVESEKKATLLGQELAAITAFTDYSIRSGDDKVKGIIDMCKHLGISLSEYEKDILNNYSKIDQDSKNNFYIQFQRKIERTLRKNLLAALTFGQNMVLFVNMLNSDGDINQSVSKVFSDLDKSRNLLNKGGKIENDVETVLEILNPYREFGIPVDVRKKVQTEILQSLIK